MVWIVACSRGTDEPSGCADKTNSLEKIGPEEVSSLQQSVAKYIFI